MLGRCCARAFADDMATIGSRRPFTIAAVATIAALLVVVLAGAAPIGVARIVEAAPQGARDLAPVAQVQGQTLRVATKEVLPFVHLDGERPAGFSIDLWEKVASDAGVQTDWVLVDSVAEQLAAVESGEVDAAIAAISMTPEREESVDFSYAYFRSGLQILTASRPLGTLTNLASVLISPRLLAIYGSMLVVLLVVGHVVWLAERRNNEQFPSGYLQGVWEGVWWSAVTVTTVGYGDRTVKGVPGRLLGLVWMFFGIFLVANFTAVVTSELTVGRLDSSVRNVGDLRSSRVAAVYGTTGAEYLSDIGVAYKIVTSVEDAIDLLQRGETDAVVYDSPVLKYHVANRRDPRLIVVGELLTHENYAIALPQGSPHEEAINAAMLKLYEDGTYAELLERWQLGDQGRF